MDAAEIVETLPTAGLDDEVLSATRTVAWNGLPGLAPADHLLVAAAEDPSG